MKNILIILALFSSMGYSQWANYERAFGAEIMLNFPVKEFGFKAGVGTGIKANVTYMFNPLIGIYSHVGYIDYKNKNKYELINWRGPRGPFLDIGLKYNFLRDLITLYGFSSFGALLMSDKITIGDWEWKEKNDYFYLDLGIGSEFQIEMDMFIDAKISYKAASSKGSPNSVKQLNDVSLSLGILFGF